MEMESKVEAVRSAQKVSTDQFQMADLLIAYLRQLGVEYVFGVPGGAIEPLYNALARSERAEGPRSIVARHETGAAFMAAGYAQNSGRLGVCCATTGPGATNLITGVTSAYENNIPLLVITAQTSLENFGRGAFQESSCTSVNVIGMFQFCTSYNTLVSHISQFERKLCAAIMTAIRTRRPVHMSVPLDVMRGGAALEMPEYDLSKLMYDSESMDAASVWALKRKLEAAENIIFVLGEGCHAAIGSILALASHLNAKVISTPHSKGFISASHPLYYGVIGFAGHKTAARLLSSDKIDLILSIGTKLSEWASNGWDESLMNVKLVHIDELERNFESSPMADLQIQGSIKKLFEELCDFYSIKSDSSHGQSQELLSESDSDQHRLHLRNFIHDDEDKYYDDSAPLKPQRLMHELTRLFPSNTKYLADIGNSMAWAIHYLHPRDNILSNNRKEKCGALLSCLEFAPMGWAIGASVGIALADAERPVVCIAGDGSFLMNGQEITVALQQKLTIIYVILNDSELGMVKHGQRIADAELIGYQLPIVNYAQLAQSMGIDGYVIKTVSDLQALNIAELCKQKRPILLDVHIDAEEVPPIKMRMKILRAA